MKKESKKIPVIYTTTTKGSLYHHCSCNPTLYFYLEKDEKRYKEDPSYAQYYDEMTKEEIPAALVNKFVISQPLVVTNDKIPFVLFKSNIDSWSLKEFCKAIVQEFSFHTGQPHQARYFLINTLFMQMDKQPTIFRSASKGEKLSRSDQLVQLQEVLECAQDPADQGIMTPYSVWMEMKRREKEDAKENEETVAW